MNIQQAKEIKLTDYLSALGHHPKRCSKSTSLSVAIACGDKAVVQGELQPKPMVRLCSW